MYFRNPDARGICLRGGQCLQLTWPHGTLQVSPRVKKKQENGALKKLHSGLATAWATSCKDYPDGRGGRRGVRKTIQIKLK